MMKYVTGKRKHSGYQDLYRDGRVIARGGRDCASRYAAIAPALEARLGRGFTVCDVGGRDGYFPARLLHEGYASAATIVDSYAGDFEGITHLRQKYRPGDQIGTFNAILCLSVLHHVKDWRAVYEGLREHCRWLVVELPAPTERVRWASELNAHIPAEGELLGHAPNLGGKVQRPTYIVRGRLL